MPIFSIALSSCDDSVTPRASLHTNGQSTITNSASERTYCLIIATHCAKRSSLPSLSKKALGELVVVVPAEVFESDEDIFAKNGPLLLKPCLVAHNFGVQCALLIVNFIVIVFPLSIVLKYGEQMSIVSTSWQYA